MTNQEFYDDSVDDLRPTPCSGAVTYHHSAK